MDGTKRTNSRKDSPESRINREDSSQYQDSQRFAQRITDSIHNADRTLTEVEREFPQLDFAIKNLHNQARKLNGELVRGEPEPQQMHSRTFRQIEQSSTVKQEQQPVYKATHEPEMDC